MSRVDQQYKYNIENIKNCQFVFAFSVLTKSTSEIKSYQNYSLILDWSVTKNILKRKEQPEA